MNTRRFPDLRELLSLLQFQPPQYLQRGGRIAAAHTIDDLRKAAKRRAHPVAFDYVEGGADDEVSLDRLLTTFRNVEFHPEALRDVSKVDLSTTVLGRRVELPFGIAPTGFTRVMHTDGELAGAAVASAAGIPFTLSTMGTASIEEVANSAHQASSAARTWFQLYVWKDRARSLELIERAAAAGYEALVVTIDVPVGGRRLRDLRNGMTIPPGLTPRTVLAALTRPAWSLDFVTSEPLAFASLDKSSRNIRGLFESMFDPSVTVDDLKWIRSVWDGPLIVKGVQSLADSVRVAEAGVQAIILSNHGGRQLDRAPTPLELLPQVAQELPARGYDTEVWLDGGIRSGGDIVAALALGARFTLIGRAYLYGLMAGGQAGGARTIEILKSETDRTMRLLGLTRIAEITSQHASLRRGEAN
jgi:L-lactate dehydrogenase (cytochrome)